MDRDFELLRYTHDKHPEAHIHEYYELFVSLSNEGTFFVRENGYPLRFGMVFVLNPFEIHRCFCRGNQVHDRYVLRFSQEYLKVLSTKDVDLETIFSSSPILYHLEGDLLAELLRLLARLKSAGESPAFGSDIEQKIILSQILLLLTRMIISERVSRVSTGKTEDRVSDILRYIHGNYNLDITLESLSKQFFISKSRLSQIFKDTTGFSVGDYILTYRIKTACTLLKSGMRVQEVGEVTGFHTTTSFIRAFKKRTGHPPGKFSKKINENDAMVEEKED